MQLSVDSLVIMRPTEPDSETFFCSTTLYKTGSGTTQCNPNLNKNNRQAGLMHHITPIIGSTSLPLPEVISVNAILWWKTIEV